MLDCINKLNISGKYSNYEHCKWHNYALLLCAFNIMTFFWGGVGVEKYIFRYIPLCISAMFLILHLYQMNFKFEWTAIDFLWTIFFFYSCLRISDYSDFSKYGLPFLYLYSLIMLIFGKTHCKFFYTLLNLFCIINVIYACSVLLQIIFPREILFISGKCSSFVDINLSDWVLKGIEKQAYISGIVGSVAYTAGYLANNIMILFLYQKISGRSNIFIKALLLVSFISLLMTGKRGHCIFLLFSLASVNFIVTAPKYKMKQLLYWVLITFLFVLIIYIGVIYFPEFGMFARVNATLNAVQNSADVTSGRMEIFEACLKQFFISPIFGNGLATFSYDHNGIKLSAHNYYLQTLSDLGIVGFCLLLVAQLYTLFITHKKLIYVRHATFDKDCLFLLSYSFCFQVFFLLYGLTENIIQYHGYILLYFLICSITDSMINNKIHINY